MVVMIDGRRTRTRTRRRTRTRTRTRTRSFDRWKSKLEHHRWWWWLVPESLGRWLSWVAGSPGSPGSLVAGRWCWGIFIEIHTRESSQEHRSPASLTPYSTLHSPPSLHTIPNPVTHPIQRDQPLISSLLPILTTLTRLIHQLHSEILPGLTPSHLN